MCVWVCLQHFGCSQLCLILTSCSCVTLRSSIFKRPVTSLVFSGHVHIHKYICTLRLSSNMLELFKYSHGYLIPQMFLLASLFSHLVLWFQAAAVLNSCQWLIFFFSWILWNRAFPVDLWVRIITTPLSEWDFSIMLPLRSNRGSTLEWDFLRGSKLDLLLPA